MITPLATRAKVVVAVFGVTIVVDLFSAWADLRESHLMDRVIAGDLPTLGELTASDHRQAISGALQLAMIVVGAVAFLVWFSPAYKNLTALGADGLRFSSGWAVGAWFVPVLNLWRPKQIADDIWRASDPTEEADQGDVWRNKAVPALLHLWWVLWIIEIGRASCRERV